MKHSRISTSDLLRETARLFTRSQRAVAECCGATSTQCHVLVELSSAGPLSQSELGNRLVLEKSWVSRAIDAMAVQGLVVKKKNPDDARSWQVSLTAKGRRTANDLNLSLNAHTEQILHRLSASERKQLEATLSTLVVALRDATAVSELPTA